MILISRQDTLSVIRSLLCVKRQEYCRKRGSDGSRSYIRSVRRARSPPRPQSVVCRMVTFGI